jgi:hypothetical protein
MREDARFRDRKRKLTLTPIPATKIIYFDVKMFHFIKKIQLFFILKLPLKQPISHF